ncbi:hypothetical protein DSECCO2_102510 [anaerobic digester metagenome]
MPGHHVFANASFALKQNRCISCRNASHIGIQTLHDRTFYNTWILTAGDSLMAHGLKRFQQFLLRCYFLSHFSQSRNIAYNSNNVDDVAFFIFDRVAVQKQSAPIIKVLHT